MTILLIVITALVLGTLLAAVVLVSFASLREESLHSVAGRPPGTLERAARHLLAFHSDDVRKPPSRAPAAGWQMIRPEPAAAPQAMTSAR